MLFLPKFEIQERFHNFKRSLDVRSLHLEPALKSVNAEYYYASNVVHTKIIDVGYSEVYDDASLRKIYNQTANHECYKQAHYLARAELLGLKPCGFVQAMVPSIFVKGRQQKVFSKLNKLTSLRNVENDRQKYLQLEAEIDYFKEQLKQTSSYYGIEDFMHYRCWFFDLDYDYPVSLEDLTSKLKEIGLFKFVNMIVQTSPTKYHLYIKSEMVATEHQVANWPIPTGLKDLKELLQHDNLKQLKIERPNMTGRDWHLVGIRGTNSQECLSSVPTPIPVDAKLRNGIYYGDDNVYRDYQYCWKEIGKILGSDLCVHNETRIAQLVGYTNPKSNFTAVVVYANKDAPVLTTRKAKTSILTNINKYYNNNNNTPFYVPLKKTSSASSIGNAFRNFLGLNSEEKQKEEKEEKEEKQQEKQTQVQKTPIEKLITKRVEKPLFNAYTRIPISFEDYCRANHLGNEIILDSNITGRSNEMLMLLSRFAHRYIDLKDVSQQELFFDLVVWDYFKDRVSKDLKRYNARKLFLKRFQSNCKHDLKLSKKTKRKVQTEITSSAELLELWERAIREKEGTDSIFELEGHRKIRICICDHIIKYAKADILNGLYNFVFQMPAAFLNKSIHGYRGKLQDYIDAGFYILGSSYIPPNRTGAYVVKGECKNHTLVLKAKTMIECDENLKENLENLSPKKDISQIEITDSEWKAGWRFGLSPDEDVMKRAKAFTEQMKEQERVRIEEMNKRKNHDPTLMAELQEKKKELRELLDKVNSVVTEKKKKHEEFLNILSESAELHDTFFHWFRYAGCLNRDNMTDVYVNRLPLDLQELWKVPCALFKEENSYAAKVEELANRICHLRFIVPHDPSEDFKSLSKTLSLNSRMTSALNGLALIF